LHLQAGFEAPTSSLDTATMMGKTSTSRRPKLMRASATAPSLAMSNASRKDLASLSTATTLLTRVASYSTTQQEHAFRASPSSSCSSPERRTPENASLETHKESFEVAIHQPVGGYFSFPSFEDFQDFQEREDRDDGRPEKVYRKEKGVS